MKAVFTTIIFVVIWTLNRFDNLKIFHGEIGESTGEDVVDIIKGKNLYILGAFTIQGTPETDGGSYRQHSGNYAKQIILFPEIGQSVNTASLSQKYSLFKTMDIKFDQFKISKDETQYYCKMFNVKKMLASTTVLPPTNQHAVAFEPILDKSQFIHHFILNSCDTEKVVWQDGYFPCPLSKEFCPLVVGVW